MRANDSLVAAALRGDRAAQAALARVRVALRAWEELQRRQVAAAVGWTAAFTIALMLGVALVLAVVDLPVR